MKEPAKILAALVIVGAMSFGTAEASENPEVLANQFEQQELKAPPWYVPPPPPHHRHKPPHFHRRPNDFDPPHYHPAPPPRHHRGW